MSPFAPTSPATRRGAAFAAESSRNRWRTPLPMRLIQTLRGDGALLSPDGETAVTYELDVFSRGGHRSLNGRLQGDFSRLVQADDAGARHERLRLADGREAPIERIAVDGVSLEFVARDALDAPAHLMARA